MKCRDSTKQCCSASPPSRSGCAASSASDRGITPTAWCRSGVWRRPEGGAAAATAPLCTLNLRLLFQAAEAVSEVALDTLIDVPAREHRRGQGSFAPQLLKLLNAPLARL